MAAASTLLGAQEAPDPDGAKLAEVVVTAQKRPERLQDVPISVTALTTATLQAEAIDSTTQLPMVTAGLLLTRQNNGVLPFLRGVGSNSPDGLEPAVSIYVDGVYYPVPQAITFSIEDVDRVEVLKGPQGTLFGRNSTGGVISFTTRDPTQQPTLDLKQGYGNFDTYDTSGYASTGVTANLATNLAVVYHDQGDGWGTNFNTGNPAYRERSEAIRNKWLLTLPDDTQMILSFDYNSTYTQMGSETRIPAGQRGIDPAYVDPGFYNVNMNGDPYGLAKQGGAALRITHDFGFSNFVSISSYRKVNNYFTLDADATPLNNTYATLNVNTTTVTQELRLLSEPKGPFNWIVGAYFFDSDFNNDPQYVTGSVLGPLKTRDIFSTTPTTSYAGYGQMDWKFLPATTLTLGARYTLDEKSIEGSTQFGVGTPAPRPISPFPKKSKNWGDPTWRIALDHKFTDSILGYVSYNRGFRSGAFNPVTFNNPPINPEKIDAYEAGMKTTLLAHRLRVNLAAFQYNLSGQQFFISEPPNTFILNAARTRIRGAEAEIAAAPFDWLTLTASFSYLDGVYTSFPNAQGFVPLPTGGYALIPGFSATGNTAIQTPTTMNLAATFRQPTPKGDASASIIYYHSGSFYWDPQNLQRQDAYDLVNASLQFTTLNERWSFKLWGRNLLDTQYYDRETINSTAYQVSPAEPRTYGVTVGFHYE